MNARALFRLIFLLSAMMLCSAASVFSQEEMMSEKTVDIAEDRTSITIRCNVYGASVFLNGEYQGVTTLTISNLQPGRYTLRIEKEGYEPQEHFIRVRSAQSQTWYIELEKNTGIINFDIEPPDASIFADGTAVSGNAAELTEGSHSLLVRRFGYTDAKETVLVFRHTVQSVKIKLEPAVFELSSFSASKKTFSPYNPGSVGTCTFSFSVTNHGSGTLFIKDSSGAQVCSFDFRDFTTWNQRCVWNGTDSAGRAVSDGVYTAQLVLKGAASLSSGTAADAQPAAPQTDALSQLQSDSEQTSSLAVSVDSSLRCPVAVITPNGSGIGILPASFTYPAQTYSLGFSAGAVFETENGPFYASPFTVSFCGTPASWFEYSLRATLLAGSEDTSLSGSAAVKFSARQYTANSDTSLDESLILRYGASNKSTYEPFGAETGNGLAAGAALGIESHAWYAGISSVFSYSACTGNMSSSDCVWQNGAAVQYRTTSAGFGIWCALNSSFGTGSSDEDERSGSYWARAVSAGIDCSAFIPSSSVSINFRPGVIIYPQNRVYFSGEIGLSILF